MLAACWNARKNANAINILPGINLKKQQQKKKQHHLEHNKKRSAQNYLIVAMYMHVSIIYYLENFKSIRIFGTGHIYIQKKRQKLFIIDHRMPNYRFIKMLLDVFASLVLLLSSISTSIEFEIDAILLEICMCVYLD